MTFRQSKWKLDSSLGNNKAVLDSLDRLFTTLGNDSTYKLRHVSFTGSASPEGSIRINRYLSERRAMALFEYLERYARLSDDEKTFLFVGRDWDGVVSLVEKDPGVPYREETLALLRDIADEKRRTGVEPSRSLERLKQLRSGKPYIYLYGKIFPAVRASKLVVGYDRVLPRALTYESLEVPALALVDSILPPPIGNSLIINNIITPVPKPFYMGVRTNMLYDALALPNIGLEFYLGRNISVGGNWMYAWWRKNASHRYWRAYGGELFGRWWFGRAARVKPLTGHHIGVYGQLYTYDFEWGGEGQMGGQPGGNLWDKAQWGAGIEYGYSLPVGRRINIDFSLGLGYTTGYYHTYKPVDTHYVWQSTKRRNWFGPTKAEISLVWFIGYGNYNRPKAGKGGGR